MEYQFEDYVQQAWDQIEMWAPPHEQLSWALSEQIRVLAGVDLNDWNVDLGIRLHTALRF